MGVLIIIGLFQVQGAIGPVDTEVAHRPPRFEPIAANLLVDPAAQPRRYGPRHVPRSPAVLAWYQRRLCLADPAAQTGWLTAAKQAPALWHTLPKCKAACEWAWRVGQADACPCAPTPITCGQDSRIGNPCQATAQLAHKCPIFKPDRRHEVMTTLSACIRDAVNPVITSGYVRSLVRHQGWRAREYLDAYGDASSGAQTARHFAPYRRGVTDGRGFEARLRADGLLAPTAPAQPDAHPTATLVEAWTQYGQAVLSHCAFRGGSYCTGKSIHTVAQATAGALADVVIHTEGSCHAKTLIFEAWAPRRVWRVTVTDCTQTWPAMLALLNAVLEHRRAWGRLHRHRAIVIYAPDRLVDDAIDRGLLTRWPR